MAGIFWKSFAAVIAAMQAHDEAKILVLMISKGFIEPSLVRIAIIVIGINVILAVLIARKVI